MYIADAAPFDLLSLRSEPPCLAALSVCLGFYRLFLSIGVNIMAVNATSLMKEFRKDIQGYLDTAADESAWNSWFNANQAKINRDWQAEMSNTAHQREVADLRAAGINPILSAYGSGASTPSGSSASADTSYAAAMGSIAQSALSTAGSLASAIESANATKFAAKKSAKATVKSAKTTAKATVKSAKTNAKATVTSAKIKAANDKKVAEMNNAANKWIAQENNKTKVETAMIEARTSKTVAKISGKYGIKKSKIQAAVTRYSAELGYLANIKETDAKTYRTMMQTLTQEFSSLLQCTMNNAATIIDKIIPFFKGK